MLDGCEHEFPFPSDAREVGREGTYNLLHADKGLDLLPRRLEALAVVLSRLKEATIELIKTMSRHIT